MFLTSSFAVILQELAVAMTVPSFHNLLTVLTGWVFARRRTITGMLTAAGVAGKRHHAAFHRLIATAQWSLDVSWRLKGASNWRLKIPHLYGGGGVWSELFSCHQEFTSRDQSCPTNWRWIKHSQSSTYILWDGRSDG